MTNNQQAARELLVTMRDEAQSLLDYANKHLDYMADTQQTTAYDWWVGRRDTLVELLERLDRPAPPGPSKECAAHQWRVDPDLGEGSGYLYCPRCDCTRRSHAPPDSGYSR